MRTLTRVQNGGTQAVLTQLADGWHIQVDLKKPDRSPVTIGFQQPTLKLAQSFADDEVIDFGHVCTRSCKKWAETTS